MCLIVRSNTSCTRFKSVTSSFNNSSLSLTLLTVKSACEEVLGTLLHDLLEEKLQVVKKFDEEILQLCEVKEIENEIEVSEELN